jgi:hypothetical protein
MIAEWSLATLLMLVPLITGGVSWFNWELKKADVAFQSYANARSELIATAKNVSFWVQIGSMQENVALVPLESLDLGPSGLTLSDLGDEVSQLSEDALHSSQRLQDLVSTASSSMSAP